MLDHEPMLLALQPPKRVGGLVKFALVRTRDRNHKKRAKKSTATTTFVVKIQGQYLDRNENKQMMSQTRMKELIHVALDNLFGEVGVESFSWQFYRYEQQIGVGHVRICTANIVAFRAALALLVSEDGSRLRVVEQTVEQ